MKRVFIFLAMFIVTVTIAFADKKKVACTLPTLEAITKEIAQDKVEVFSLAKGEQDPHFVSPTPSLMKKLREAELFIEIGMSLELWADEVANGSGNSKIYKSAEGRITVSLDVSKLEVPKLLSKAEGDIHPDGNPHIWLDPIRAKIVASSITTALKKLLPDDKEFLEKNLKAFEEKIDKALFGEELIKEVGSKKLTRLVADGKLFQFLEENKAGDEKLINKLGGWLKEAEQLRNIKAVEFHKVWCYFAQAFDFKVIGTIEEKPGINPGPKHIKAITELIKNEGVKLILVDNFYDPTLPNKIAKETDAKVIIIPNQVGGEKEVDDYFKLIDFILDKMLEGVKK